MSPLLSPLSRPAKRLPRRKPARTSRPAYRRLAVEWLEDRAVPAAISIDDATAVEGSAALKSLDRFIPDGSGGLTAPARQSVFGPDGNHDGAPDLYVASAGSNAILRYDGTSGSFIDAFVTSGSGGLNGPFDLAFGPDGNLYVSMLGNNPSSPPSPGQVLRYDGSSGAFLGVVASGLTTPDGITFGGDGSLYIASEGTNEVLRYRNSILSVFVTAGSGGLSQPRKAVFGPDANGDGVNDLYVASQGNGKVLRYDGQTGAFIDTFASSNTWQGPMWLNVGADGYLYTTERLAPAAGNTGIVRFNAASGAFADSFPLGRDGWSFVIGPQNIVYSSANATGGFIERFGPASLAAFMVRLDSPSASPVTVQFSTANGTAVAGTDYVPATGTLTFAPGQTTRTILVRTSDDTLSEGPETFVVNLSNPVGATITDAQAVGTITDNEPPLAQIESVVVNGGAAQRSRVTEVTVTFNAVVTFAGGPGNAAAAFRLTRTGPGGPAGDVTLAVDLSGSTATQTIARLTFSGPLTEFGSLLDGRYTLTVLSAQVSAGGQPLDGDGDGVAGGDAVSALHRLYGDVTGDGTVNGADFNPFRLAFGAGPGNPNYVAALDFDGDGFVIGADFNEFRRRFGLSI
jgi:hypothetical protein